MMHDNTRTRAQRRRDERDKKPALGAQGLSRKELADAEDELQSFMSDGTGASHGIVWTTFVEQWQTVNYQRESARTAYARRIELHKKGRTGDTKVLVTAYAEAKQELELLEDQAIEFLKNDDFRDEEIQSFLYDQRPIPGRGMLIRPPEAFVEVLKARLHECSKDIVGDRCEESVGSEVHGSGS